MSVTEAQIVPHGQMWHAQLMDLAPFDDPVNLLMSASYTFHKDFLVKH